jgi:hypothetical protein
LRAVADLELRKMNTLDKSCGNTRAANTPAAALGGAVAHRGRENVFDLIEPTWSVVIHVPRTTRVTMLIRTHRSHQHSGDVADLPLKLGHTP